MAIVLLILSVALSYAILNYLVTHAATMGLVDQPSERKLHLSATPSMGGVALIIAVVSFAPLCLSQTFGVEEVCVLLSVLLLGVLSFVDDLIDLNFKIRLLVQYAVVSIAWGVGFRLDDLFGLFGVNELGSLVSYALTVIFCMGLINAYNLIDGIDGLLGGLSISSFVFLGYSFYMAGEVFYLSLCAVVTGFLVAFIGFNRNPAKIFMGDTGSMVIGFLLAILSMKLFHTDAVIIRGYNYQVLFLVIHLIPAYDMVRVMIGRLMKRRSVFHADRTHVHHIFLGIGWSVNKISAILFLVHKMVLILPIFVPEISITWLLILDILFVAAVCEIPLWVKILTYRSREKSLEMQRMELISTNRFLSKF